MPPLKAGLGSLLRFALETRVLKTYGLSQGHQVRRSFVICGLRTWFYAVLAVVSTRTGQFILG